MGSLARRVARAEEQIDPDAGTSLRWPNPDGTFTEIHGGRTQVDVYVLCAAREHQRENGGGPCTD